MVIFNSTHIIYGEDTQFPNQTKKDHGTFYRAEVAKLRRLLLRELGPETRKMGRFVDLDGSLIGFLYGNSWKLMGVNGS